MAPKAPAKATVVTNDNVTTATLALRCFICDNTNSTELAPCRDCAVVAICDTPSGRKCSRTYALTSKCTFTPATATTARIFVCFQCTIRADLRAIRDTKESLSEALDHQSIADLMQSVTPWFYILMKASAQDKLDALMALKHYGLTSHEQWVNTLSNMESADAKTFLDLNSMAVNANSTVEMQNSAKAAATKLRNKGNIHTKWRNLLIPDLGGSYDICLNYLRQVLASQANTVTKAMAEERIFILERINDYYTDRPKSGKHNITQPVPSKAALGYALSLFQLLSRKIKHPPTQRNQEKNVIFEHVYGPFTGVLRLRPSAAPYFCNLIENAAPHRAAPAKAHTTGEINKAPPKDNPTGEPTKKQKAAALRLATDAAAAAKAKAKTPNPPPNPPQRPPCRNCVKAGKPDKIHTMDECRRLGNACLTNCSLCKTPHWHSDCPRKDELEKHLRDTARTQRGKGGRTTRK